MKKSIVLFSIILFGYAVRAQTKPAPKADSVNQYVIVMNLQQLQSLQNFIFNPTFFTVDGGKAYWNNSVAPLIRAYKVPVPVDSASKK